MLKKSAETAKSSDGGKISDYVTFIKDDNAPGCSDEISHKRVKLSKQKGQKRLNQKIVTMRFKMKSRK